MVFFWLHNYQNICYFYGIFNGLFLKTNFFIEFKRIFEIQ